MSLPLITIGMATFNAIDTVEDAIKSAIYQNWRPIEIIALDDYSTDGTFELLKTLSKKYKELRVLRNSTNQGIGFVRNRLVQEAKGEFIAFFDDDDKSIKDRLKIQYKRIIEYEKVYGISTPVICHSSRLVFFPDGTTRLHKTMGTATNKKCPSGESVAKRILLGRPLKDGYGSCPTCSQMGRLNLYKKVQGFDKIFRRSEDTDLCISLSFIGTHFLGIEEPLVMQKMTKSSDKNLDIEFKYSILYLKKYKSFIDENGNYFFCLRWLTMKYFFSKRKFIKMIFNFLILLIRFPYYTLERFFLSLSSLRLNNDFARFHEKEKSS